MKIKIVVNYCYFRLASETAGFTPAQLTGLVRQAQMAALTRAQQTDTLNKVTIEETDFRLQPRHPHSKPELTAELCAGYSSIHGVINGSLARTALVHVETYGNIVPCLKFFVEGHGYLVKVSRVSPFK